MKNFIVIFSLVCSNLLFSQNIQQVDLGAKSAKIINKGKFKFKDLNKNNKLDLYEDWRLPVDKRIADLITKMTLEEKVGFMLISTSRLKGDYSFQQNAPRVPIESGFNEEDLVQENNMFSRKPLPFPMLSAAGTTKAIHQNHLRHFILRANTNAKTLAEWANNIQAACENTRLGIPAIIASNPRNHITIDASIGLSVGATSFSKWPGELGLAAMNDLALTRRFAEIASQEWRAIGLRKAYMYMADIATEPRWQRNEGTFGENGDWAAKMMREIVIGFQGEKLSQTSVALTTKHFPGGGPQVEGHDPHFEWGKFQHYPGKMFDYHLKPFIAAIDAGTSSIMPYYAVPVGSGYEEIAFAYNKGVLQDLLRKKLGFKGIINSDTGPIEMMPWGVENLTIHARYQKAVECGVDLFSGSADPKFLYETVQMGLISEDRINESISRLLKEKFDLGLFENPYVDAESAEKNVGKNEYQAEADLALRKSIVLLRNQESLLPLKPGTKVFFETQYDNGRSPDVIKTNIPANHNWAISFVESRDQADVVVQWLTPNMGSLFNTKEGQDIELQLSKCKIDVARVNENTYHKPTVTIINYTSPWIIDEIDNPNMKAVLATFGTSTNALFDVLTGKFKPQGKMPISTPKSKKAVLENQSDVPGYMKPNYALFKFGDGLSY
jgi:beta-glucosidase